MVGLQINWKTEAALVAGLLVLYYVAKHEAKAAVAAVNPVNPDNLANQAANGVFHAISGNNVDTIGTWLYGLLHPDAGAATTAPTPLNWGHASPPVGD